MDELLIGIGLGLFFFYCTIFAYSLGIKHGRIVKHDGVPNVNPIKAVTDIKKESESKKQMDDITQGLQNILNYGNEKR